MISYKTFVEQFYGEDAVAGTTTANIPTQPIVSQSAAEKYKRRNAGKAEDVTNIATLVPRIVPTHTIAESAGEAVSRNFYDVLMKTYGE